MRTTLPGALAALAYLVPATAAAQPGSSCEGGPDPDHATGWVPYQTARIARITNATVYGAVNTVDQHISPYMYRRDENDRYRFGIYYGYSSVFSAVRAPSGYPAGCVDRADGWGMRSYDLNAMYLAFGLRYEDFTLYYAGSTTTGYFVDHLGDRAYQIGLNYLAGFYINPMAWAGSLWDESMVEGPTIDGLVALSYASPVGEMRVGVLRSKGFYTNITSAKIRAFFSSVLQDSFSRLPFLKAGFAALSLGEDVREDTGTTNVYARKVQLDSTDASGPIVQAGAEYISMWTTHLGQKDIMRYVDADIAVAITPKPMLHVGTVGVHTPGFNHEFDVMRAIDREQTGDLDEQIVGAGAWLGSVTMPDMYYYGVEGGTRPAFIAEARGRLGAGVVRFRYAYNDPETLTVFPMALDSWSFTLALGYLER